MGSGFPSAAATEATSEIPALEVRQISKRYRDDRDALVRVDLVVRAGELHGLLGPNGAGKTTLLRVLFGLVRQDAGTVRFFGGVQDKNAARLPDGVSGFVETPHFYPYLTGRRNLKLLSSLDASSAGDADVSDALDAVGLGRRRDTPVAAYSAGMRQRLGIAAALLRRPRLLLIDEPTSALDPAGARDLRSLARKLAGDGAAVVWSSHDMSEVEELCGSATILNRGQVVFSGTLAELQARGSGAVHRLRTSDDRRARLIAAEHERVAVDAAVDADGLDVTGATEAVDRFVIALAGEGIAVRALERRASSLETLFLRLTGGVGGSVVS